MKHDCSGLSFLFSQSGERVSSSVSTSSLQAKIVVQSDCIILISRYACKHFLGIYVTSVQYLEALIWTIPSLVSGRRNVRVRLGDICSLQNRTEIPCEIPNSVYLLCFERYVQNYFKYQNLSSFKGLNLIMLEKKPKWHLLLDNINTFTTSTKAVSIL